MSTMILNLNLLNPQACERWAVIGRNAVGKTTLLNALARSDRDRFALMPQHHVDAFSLPVREWLALHTHQQLTDKAVITRRAEELDIAHLLARPVTKLSGGERQRVGLAAVALQQKSCWLLDEPVSAQDPAHQGLIAQWLVAESRNSNVAMVFVAHDISWIARVATHVYAFVGTDENDASPLIGAAAEVLTPHNLEAIYGCQFEAQVFRSV